MHQPFGKVSFGVMTGLSGNLRCAACNGRNAPKPLGCLQKIAAGRRGVGRSPCAEPVRLESQMRSQQLDVGREHELIEAHVQPSGALIRPTACIVTGRPTAWPLVDDALQRIGKSRIVAIEAEARPRSTGPMCSPEMPFTAAISATSLTPRWSSIIG